VRGRRGLHGCGGLALACVAGIWLTGCVDDWLGHPGRASQTPRAADWAMSEPARELLAETFADMPDHIVDHGAYLVRRQPDSGWFARLRAAIWADATGVSDSTRWRPAYVDRLRALTDLPSRDIELVVLTEQTDDSAGWPARWIPVAQGPVGKDRWIHGLTLAGGDPEPDRLWIDLTPLEDPGPALKLAASHAAAGQMVFLLGCLRADVERWQACLRTLRASEQQERLYILVDGLGRPDTVSALLNGLLQQVDLFDRLRYASAYPYPAINTNIWLDELVWAGFIERDDVAPLRELYAYNPWLFDLALKRRLRLPGTEIALTPEVFGPVTGE